MRLARFFTDRKNITLGSSIKLDENQSSHIRKTLRLEKGDDIVIFNGEKEYLAKLKIVSNEFCTAEILKVTDQTDLHNEKNISITLFLSIIKPNRFEDALEKCSELGIDNIVPIQTEFSQIKADRILNKYDRWNKIILEACKQSERIKIPKLYDPLDFKDIESMLSEFDKKYFFNLPVSYKERVMEGKRIGDHANKVDMDSTVSNIAYFIGPEGGFSPTEQKLATKWGLDFYSLGENILRAETAAISALSILNYLYH